MSEAALPNPDIDVVPTESNDLATPTISDASSPPPSDDWQTVDFPGALSVDAIPPHNEEGPPDAEEGLPPINHEGEDWIALVKHLQQENALLRDRVAALQHEHVAELERDLAQTQVELQLARSLQQESIAQAQDLATAQEHSQRLFQELERAHQTARRQQILIETLTKQLDSSQTRIAQLERDCSLTQQRCNEHVQQRMQAENTSRDLRMRLHRQQQQTLQFKAALEQCLEMPAAAYRPPVGGADGGAPAPLTDAAQLLSVQHQPVKPWSAPNDRLVPYPAPPAAQTPLSRLLNVEPLMPSEASDPMAIDPATSDAPSMSDWMNVLFPDAPNTPAATETEPVEAIFDVSPFLQASKLPEAAPAIEEPLWEDLTALIESPPVEPAASAAPAESDSATAEQRREQLAQAALAGRAVALPPHDRPAPLAETPLPQLKSAPDTAPSDPIESAPAPRQIRPLQVAALSAQPPTPEAPKPFSFDLNSQPEDAAAPQGEPMFTPNFPSPIVYPLRPAKKLSSLAAVDLPTFPRGT